METKSDSKGTGLELTVDGQSTCPRCGSSWADQQKASMLRELGAATLRLQEATDRLQEATEKIRQLNEKIIQLDLKALDAVDSKPSPDSEHLRNSLLNALAERDRYKKANERVEEVVVRLKELKKHPCTIEQGVAYCISIGDEILELIDRLVVTE